jgi:hypothetical protein
VGHGALRRPAPRSSGAYFSCTFTQTPVTVHKLHAHAFRSLDADEMLLVHQTELSKVWCMKKFAPLNAARAGAARRAPPGCRSALSSLKSFRL